MKTKILFLNVLLLLLIPAMVVNAKVKLPTIYPTKYSILTYGASTSSTDNATAINAAITAANSAGGGTVVIPAGTFLSGPITMKSNVNLYLSKGSILQILPYGTGNGTGTAGSTYYPNNGTADQYSPFIYGKGLNNIAVTGTGTIEGNGAAWWSAYNSDTITSMKRPCLIRFVASNYVLIDSITLKNSPGVHVTLGQSSSMGSNGTISNITVSAPDKSPNTDAIDTWYWNGINITNCSLSAGDDNVAIDSYSKNINIKNCNLGFGHGVSVGSYTTGVDSVLVDSCTFNYTTNGIRLKSARDRSSIDSVFTYSNITMNNVTNPFYITGFYPKETYPASSATSSAVTATTPSFRKVTFKNITVTGATNAGIIYGVPELPCQEITFDNVHIAATTKGMIVNFAKGVTFNCSSISIPSGKGNAITSYGSTLSGIDTVGGTSSSCINPTIELTSGSVLESVKKDSALTSIVYTYGGTADTAIVSALPSGITASVNTTNKTVTLTGTLTTIGSYPYKVTAISSTDSAAISAQIICSSASAYKVAYVTTPSNREDNLILNKLTANKRFAVTVEDAASSSLNVSNYDLVVISPVPSSGAAGMIGLKTVDKPRLLLKPFTLKSTVWNWGTAVNAADSSVAIKDKTHQIFDGLTFSGANNDELQLFSTVVTYGVTGITASTWATTPTVLANATSASTTNSIVEIPVGTSMNGTLVNKRFIMIGLSEISTQFLTPTATQLIENTCFYLLGDSTASDIQTVNAASAFTVIQSGNTIRVNSAETVTGLQLIGITGITYAKATGNELTEQLQPGVYILEISYGNNQAYYKKVFIK